MVSVRQFRPAEPPPADPGKQVLARKTVHPLAQRTKGLGCAPLRSVLATFGLAARACQQESTRYFAPRFARIGP